MDDYKDLTEKFSELTGEKFRAITFINTNEGIEEWRAVVDSGEYPAESINFKGLKKVNRKIKKSKFCYQFFIKGDQILKYELFEIIYPIKNLNKNHYVKNK